ncbi:MAG: EamA family transporter [Armatimonadia bacterium]|nr:EamA family transporter [Armatimonadia bacterium]
MPQSSPEEQARPVEHAHVSPWTWVLLATVPLTWGFNFISLKVLKEDFGVAGPLAGVYGLLSARYALMVVALMLTLWIIERDLTIRREHWRYLLGFAFVTVVIYQGTFAAGVFYTLAAEGALLISTAPIWAALINAVLGWEKLTLRQAVGTMLGFVGIAAVVAGGLNVANAPEHHGIGIAIMALAGILWASYAVFSKPLLKHYSPLKVTAWIHTLGAVVLIPVGAPAALQVDWAGMSWQSWGCLVHFSLLAGVYAFVVWYRGVQTIGSSRTVLFQYCVPLVATVLAYLLLKEVPTWLQIAGIVVTLTGVNLAVRKGGKREADGGDESPSDDNNTSAAIPSGE